MKALKEKRISLRSLWRRGLVILSLFALVFASCNTSGDDSSSSGPVDGGNVTDGRTIERVVWDKLPTENQYYAMPVNLKGLEATVYYHVPGGGEVKGETIKYDEDPSQFTVYPRIVLGSYNQAGTFIPYSNGYRITLKKGGDFRVWTPATTRYITRDDTRDWTNPVPNNNSGNDWLLDPNQWRPTGTDPTGVPGYYDNGLQLTGPPGKVLTACVDDDKFDFSGLTLNASYNDNTWQKLDFDYVTWRVIPNYPAGKDKDGVYPGFIYITVGDYPSAYDYPSYLGNDALNTLPPDTYGITIRVPLAKAYTVTDIEVVMAGDTTKVTDYAFWEENTAGAWVKRLIDAKASLKVNYTGSQPSKTLAVDTINNKKRIWWNENPTENQGFAGRMLDFDVIPVAYPFTKKGNPDPLITVYYRGAKTTIPVDVYTSLNGYEFDEIDIWDYHNPSEVRDNDIKYIEGMTEAQFVAKINPTAEYTAYNSGKKKTYKLTNWVSKASWDAELAAGRDPAATLAKGLTYFTNYADVTAKIKKDGVKKAVQITHAINSAAVRTQLEGLADARYGAGASRSGATRWVYTVKGHTFPYYDQVAGYNLPEYCDPANATIAGALKNIWYNPKAYTLKYVNNQPAPTIGKATRTLLFTDSPIFIFDAAAKTQKKKWNVNVVWETKVTVTN